MNFDNKKVYYIDVATGQRQSNFLTIEQQRPQESKIAKINADLALKAHEIACEVDNPEIWNENHIEGLFSDELSSAELSKNLFDLAEKFGCMNIETKTKVLNVLLKIDLKKFFKDGTSLEQKCNNLRYLYSILRITNKKLIHKNELGKAIERALDDKTIKELFPGEYFLNNLHIARGICEECNGLLPKFISKIKTTISGKDANELQNCADDLHFGSAISATKLDLEILKVIKNKLKTQMEGI